MPTVPDLAADGDLRDFSVRLCEQVSEWRYDDLPQAVVERLKLFMVDTFGVIAGAGRAPALQRLNERLSCWETGGASTLLLGGGRLSPPSAALANGSAAHLLDFDDQHDLARVHSNCVVLPALLATAETLPGVDGREFLLALAIGTELHARFGLACPNSLGWGWHPTMVFGALAGALACGRLLGLRGAHLLNALGMAYHQASGSAQSMRDAAMSKQLGVGFAARAAVLSAFLAADGLSAANRPLEGSAGLFALYERGQVDVRRLTGSLADEWQILRYSLKPYPCCRATHTLIGIGLSAHRQGLHPQSVASVRIGLGEFNWTAVGGRYDPQRQDAIHAKFNAGYVFARALVDGRVDMATFAPQALANPDSAALTAITRAEVDPRIGAAEIYPAYVTMQFKNGEVLELFSDRMKGSPGDPMSQSEVTGKFLSCMREGLGVDEARARDLLAAIESLEFRHDVGRALTTAFPGTPARREA